MAIKIKNIDPKPTDFTIDDIVINSKTGVIFYKDNSNKLYKIQGDQVDTTVNEQSPTQVVSFSDVTNIKQTTILNFSADILASVTVEKYLPFNSNFEDSNDQYYHIFLAPFDGQVKQITVGAFRADQSSLGTITLRTRKSAGNDFDLDESSDILETQTLAGSVKQTSYSANFTNSTFSKGDQLAFTFQQSNSSNDDIEIVGTIVLEFNIN